MREIGGYFELELNRGREYHSSAIRLNLGRTAFEYILRAKMYKKVYLPCYTCDVMLEPISRLSIEFEFYKIDINFRPVFDFSSVQKQEVFVYNNYFGICDTQVAEVAGKCKNLIVDNSQAFFSKPLPFVDTFYSPRKFFGVPDGGYLFSDKILDKDLYVDNSKERFGHLIGRIEDGAEESYQIFKSNDKKLNYQPIKRMSKITQRILQSIDYSKIAEIRKNNFNYLHENLEVENLFALDIKSNSVPITYPFISKNKYLRKHLIKNKIFVAQYWPNVLKWVSIDSIEFNLVSNIIHLPVDQRYSLKDLKRIIIIIKNA